MRIVVFGSGGVGGYFGGRLAQAGEDVVFVARGAHLEAIRQDGLRVESVDGDFRVHPAAATDDVSGIDRVDLVVVGVKAWQVREAAAAIRPLIGAGTIVLPLQNGVLAADQLGDVVGRAHVLGGVCRILSFVAGPGHIRHAGVAPRIEFGERSGPPTPRIAALRTLFERARGIDVVTPDDIESAIWEKFLFIAPVGGVGAVTRMPAGVFRRVPETRAMLQSAMSEIFDLAAARGIRLRDDAVTRTLGYVDHLPADATASMHRDIAEGRPSELEDQNGAVVRLGGEAGLAVPTHTFIYHALLPSERRARGDLQAAG